MAGNKVGEGELYLFGLPKALDVTHIKGIRNLDNTPFMCFCLASDAYGEREGCYSIARESSVTGQRIVAGTELDTL